tara:strand:- start:1503 stop:2198 length:696 start_codon:yes stop_codon:yes gene_type:complete
MPTDTFNPDLDGWTRAGPLPSSAAAVAANGSFSRADFGNVSWVGFGTSFYTARTYMRFDTTSIATTAVATSANITARLQNARGSTVDGIEVCKLCKSSDNSSLFSSALHQTITTTCSNTTTDIGNTPNSDHTFTIDGDLLTYLNQQLAAGVKPAFHLRSKADYDVATEGDASGVNTRGFYGNPSAVGGIVPVLSITYNIPSAGYSNDVLGEDDVAKVNGIAVANISKVIGV